MSLDANWYRQTVCVLTSNHWTAKLGRLILRFQFRDYKKRLILFCNAYFFCEEQPALLEFLSNSANLKDVKELLGIVHLLALSEHKQVNLYFQELLELAGYSSNNLQSLVQWFNADRPKDIWENN